MADIMIAAMIAVAGYLASVAVGLVLARKLFPKRQSNVWVYGNMVATDQSLSDEQIKRIREEIAKAMPTIARHAERAVTDRNRRGRA